MTKAELDITLKQLFSNQEKLIAEIYFVLKVNDAIQLRFADIEESAQLELTTQFVERVRTEILEDEDLEIINISSADDRRNALYEYDLDEVPCELNVMDEIIKNEDLPVFSFKDDKLENIFGIVVFIGDGKNNLVLYKKHYAVSLFKKDSVFSLTRLGNDQRFARLTDDVIKINSSFEFFRLNETLFIKDLDALEKFFGFHRVIHKNAEACLKLIEDAGLLDNPEEMKALIEDISFARKLTKIAASSPVLGRIPVSAIIAFTESHPRLKGKFQYNQDKSRLHLATKASKKLFVKLLNDDYLRSELTALYYESLAKDEIESA